MAKALDLFGPARHGTSAKSYRARTVTAWALCKYNYPICSNSFTYSTGLKLGS